MLRMLESRLVSHGLVAVIAALALACTTVNPQTGQQEIDPLPTAAAVAGAAAVGALVWGVSNNSNGNDDDDHHHHGGHGYRPFSPAAGVWCYPDQQRCYNDDGFAKKWTRRVFED